MTDQMRGLVIIFIVVYHYVINVFSHTVPLSKYIDPWWGFGGVATFLILSGFGLTRSYLTKGIEQNYLIKRIARVLIPYWIISLVWVAADFFLLNIKHTIPELIQILTGFIGTGSYINNADPNMWFVTYIVFLYIVFFFIFRTKFNNNIKTTTMLFVLSVFYVFKNKLASHGYINIARWGDFTFCFPFGVMIGLAYDKVNAVIKKLKISEVLFIFGLLLITSWVYKNMNNFFIGITFISLIITFSYLKVYSSFLLFIGTISYELYLIHGPLIVKYNFLLANRPFFISFLAYFLIIAVAAYALHKIGTDYLYSQLIKKLTAKQSVFQKIYSSIKLFKTFST